MKRTKYAMLAAGIAMVVLSTGGLLRSRGSEASSPTAKAGVIARAVIAAPGRVEAVSEEVRVGSELSGRLKVVRVEEGDRVQRGQVLAEIQNDDYRARVREEEATLAEREAVLNNAKSEAVRRRGLADRNVISRDEAERYERAYQVAQAQYDQAAQHFALVDADTREEDRAKAEAQVATAEAQLAEARADLEKSYIRAPLGGVILRKLRHTGESVSTQFDSPVVTMADDAVLRVRLDVDESDVAKLRVGQRAYVTAEAYGDHRFWGRVVRVGGILGKKNIRTDEPSEHVDTKILETLVELDRGQRLPLGLRVDSFLEIETDGRQK
jgi:HlyD family secretion protein